MDEAEPASRGQANGMLTPLVKGGSLFVAW